ncbi:YbhB/YbcL family Raf kinase inhibitor-like protein [Terriglobus tenax]|uniref:YbhB/YbcL family Raf kinase inhibitor-like protein n=1 Tax=Terriglobus tenax TaxID=1111115 RepID=UPI0021E014EC|nr:YbhB/YbcL family Raf kinase inhibitor-like protein [Terriglobus tenax]
MRRILATLPLAVSCLVFAQTPAAPQPPRLQPATHHLELSSPAFADGAVIDDKYAQATPASKPVSPKLDWTGTPTGTSSFLLIMTDEEYAPQRRFAPWLHWVIFNIPGTATGLPEGVPAEKQLPDGSVQLPAARVIGYLGPGAGAGLPLHHYTLTLYALDTRLDLGPDATIDQISTAATGHILDKAFLVMRYRKPQ